MTLRMGIDVGSTTIKLVLLDLAADPEHDVIEFETYRRHHADVRKELDILFQDVLAQFPDAEVQGAVTGSGGLSVAEMVGLPFVQEVIAETEAIQRYLPDTDVIIELGGEDAKITYLHPTPEQRMNGTCAGGTGAFIDQMASLLHTDAAGLNDLAARYDTLYPIASRCGVFAKSDLQPLLNEGAAHTDLAASVLTAVVNQTISGLACGRPIRGNVVFLGGPLFFLPELRAAFERTLGEQVDSFAVPDKAQLYVAIGAALLADEAPMKLAEVVRRSREGEEVAGTAHRMRPLFANQEELDEFNARHGAEVVPKGDLWEAKGDCFLGIDAGSTTIKAALIDSDKRLLFSHYASNEGDPVGNAVAILRTIREGLPEGTKIARTCVTGYGEGLVKAALRADDGEIETMAHFRAAEFLSPGVTSVIDIGGQDMKYLRIKDGVIDSIAVNEACSSGCGSFLSTFANTMDRDIIQFAQAAKQATAPVDLGSRCTVFMNSSVKQAQKEGAGVEDISAGLSYSVVRNALYKVIKLRNPEQLGDHVVVQGGTFLNDSVLRAFELLTGLNVVRPDIAGLMGAFGAALIARQRYLDAMPGLENAGWVRTPGALNGVDSTGLASLPQGDGHSCSPSPAASGVDAGSGPVPVTIGRRRPEIGGDIEPVRLPVVAAEEAPEPEKTDLSAETAPAFAPAGEFVPGELPGTRLLDLDELDEFSHTSELDECNLCQNSCQLTISTFADGSRHVTGNRCDRGADPDRRAARKRPKSELPNLVEAKYKRMFAYRRLTEAKAFRGDIGMPRTLNMYENYPFWFTMFTELGFRVLLSGRSDEQLFEDGMDSIASENVCYPAKLAHGHVEDLISRGVKTIWYPCIAFEQAPTIQADNTFNCPVVTSYPEVIGNNVESIAEGDVKLIRPFLSLANRELLVDRMMDALAEYDINRDEMSAAVAAAYAEDDKVRQDVRQMGRDALAYMEETGTRGIVLAGRPYHVDPQIHHGIPELINSLGMAVLTEDAVTGISGENGHSLIGEPLRVRNQWAYHVRLYEAAAFVGTRDDLELVQLNSFGCGIDAITSEQVADILEAAGKVYTTLKIDEVSNLGAARIRIRSLIAATRERRALAGADEQAAAKAAAIAEQAATSENGLALSRPSGVTPRLEFTKEHAEKHTILLPQMAPVQFRMFEAVLLRAGYNVVLLEKVEQEAIELGLQYVNNDSCYPAIVVVGQLLDALRSGEFDTDNCSVFMSQTGGQCRATNYVSLLRKGLEDAGFGHVPVVALSGSGIERNEGWKWTLPTLHVLIQSVVIGDTLQTLLLRTRPYEVHPGDATRLYERWDAIAREFILHKGRSATWGGKIRFRKLVHQMVREFDELPLRDIPRKPRVGIVGEILLKFHPDANNDAIGVVESEGCEAAMPGIMGFVLNTIATADWKYEHYGIGEKSRHVYNLVRKILQKYQSVADEATLATNGKFDTPESIENLMEKASQVVSLGNQAGEGWYLTAEMISLIEEGVPNIICAQPFACLPNHVTGKGMFRELRRRYPQSNVTAVDYDPGASQVNQLNRIKLMISTAMSRAAEQRETEKLQLQVADMDAARTDGEPAVAGSARR